jgi:hypothetical protein
VSGGVRLANLSDALPIDAFVRATIRALLVLAVYWLLRVLLVKRKPQSP